MHPVKYEHDNVILKRTYFKYPKSCELTISRELFESKNFLQQNIGSMFLL